MPGSGLLFSTTVRGPETGPLSRSCCGESTWGAGDWYCCWWLCCRDCDMDCWDDIDGESRPLEAPLCCCCCCCFCGDVTGTTPACSSAFSNICLAAWCSATLFPCIKCCPRFLYPSMILSLFPAIRALSSSLLNLSNASSRVSCFGCCCTLVFMTSPGNPASSPPRDGVEFAPPPPLDAFNRLSSSSSARTIGGEAWRGFRQARVVHAGCWRQIRP